ARRAACCPGGADPRVPPRLCVAAAGRAARRARRGRRADRGRARTRCDAGQPRPDGDRGRAPVSLADRVRADFPILSRTIGGRRLVYLDSAATAQKPQSVLDAVRLFYERSNSNVHRSIHTLGEEATELYEGARDRVRAFIGARHREEIVFTKGTTEAINLVVHTWARRAVGQGDGILPAAMAPHSKPVPWLPLA